MGGRQGGEQRLLQRPARACLQEPTGALWAGSTRQAQDRSCNFALMSWMKSSQKLNINFDRTLITQSSWSDSGWYHPGTAPHFLQTSSRPTTHSVQSCFRNRREETQYPTAVISVASRPHVPTCVFFKSKVTKIVTKIIYFTLVPNCSNDFMITRNNCFLRKVHFLPLLPKYMLLATYEIGEAPSRGQFTTSDNEVSESVTKWKDPYTTTSQVLFEHLVV